MAVRVEPAGAEDLGYGLVREVDGYAGFVGKGDVERAHAGFPRREVDFRLSRAGGSVIGLKRAVRFAEIAVGERDLRQRLEALVNVVIAAAALVGVEFRVRAQIAEHGRVFRRTVPAADHVHVGFAEGLAGEEALAVFAGLPEARVDAGIRYERPSQMAVQIDQLGAAAQRFHRVDQIFALAGQKIQIPHAVNLPAAPAVRRVDHVGGNQHVVLRFPEAKRRVPASRVHAVQALKAAVLGQHRLGGLDIGRALVLRNEQTHHGNLRDGAGDHAVLEGVLALRADVVAVPHQLVNRASRGAIVLFGAAREARLILFGQPHFQNALCDIDDAGVVRAAVGEEHAVLVLAFVNEEVGEARARFQPRRLARDLPRVGAKADERRGVLNAPGDARRLACFRVKRQRQQRFEAPEQRLVQLGAGEEARGLEGGKQPVPRLAVRAGLLRHVQRRPARGLQIERPVPAAVENQLAFVPRRGGAQGMAALRALSGQRGAPRARLRLHGFALGKDGLLRTVDGDEGALVPFENQPLGAKHRRAAQR